MILYLCRITCLVICVTVIVFYQLNLVCRVTRYCVYFDIQYNLIIILFKIGVFGLSNVDYLSESYTPRSVTSNMTSKHSNTVCIFSTDFDFISSNLCKCCNPSTFRLENRLMSSNHVLSFR